MTGAMVSLRRRDINLLIRINLIKKG